ncbi:MAG: hypothetical protein AB8H47_17350 [Bacteroidia bacterium]
MIHQIQSFRDAERFLPLWLRILKRPERESSFTAIWDHQQHLNTHAMLLFQLSFLFVSFSFFGPRAQPQIVETTHASDVQICTPCDLLCFAETSSPQAAISLLSQNQLVLEDNLENEICFLELLETLVSIAIVDSGTMVYPIIDSMGTLSDGYASEAIEATLGHLFVNDQIDFLSYYAVEASEDFKFHIQTEFSLLIDMEEEQTIDALKADWISSIQVFSSSAPQNASLEAFVYEIQAL